MRFEKKEFMRVLNKNLKKAPHKFMSNEIDMTILKLNIEGDLLDIEIEKLNSLAKGMLVGLITGLTAFLVVLITLKITALV